LNETKAYLRLFRPDSSDFSVRELRGIIEAELEKAEPDADLIEDCLDALSSLKANRSSGTRLFRQTVKIALAAALISVLTFGAFAAARQIFGFDAPNGIIEFLNDRIRFNANKSENVAQDFYLPNASLAEDLADNGLSGVHLPEAFFSGDYELKKTVYEHEDFIISANIGVTSKSVDGAIVITRYLNGSELPVVDYPAAENAAHIVSSGIDVYVFENAEGSVITYALDKTVYIISLDCGLSQASDIAATVK